MITIVDYGVGNVTAIENLFARLSIPCLSVTKPEKLKLATKIIIGVGAFDDTMKRLNRSGLRDTLDEMVLTKNPCLGVCVGMQIMAHKALRAKKLGWFDESKVVKINLPLDIKGQDSHIWVGIKFQL